MIPSKIQIHVMAELIRSMSPGFEHELFNAISTRDDVYYGILNNPVPIQFDGSKIYYEGHKQTIMQDDCSDLNGLFYNSDVCFETYINKIFEWDLHAALIKTFFEFE